MKPLRLLIESIIKTTEGAVWPLVLADFREGYLARKKRQEREAYCRLWLRMYARGY